MTDQLATSFASLVKNNNGFFKSEKQAAFLLSQCNSGTFETSSSFFGHSYDITYFCDEKGVYTVMKHGRGGYVTIWERVEAGKTSIQESKEFKRLTRLVKEKEKSIANRQAVWDSGKYAADFDSIEGATYLFNENQTFDKEMLQMLNAKLETLK